MLEPTARVAIEDEDRVTPYALLPAQVPTRHFVTPERALLSTMLMDAIECFQKHHAATTDPHRQLFVEAEEWIFGSDGEAAFSFEEVCEYLSLDAECLRSGLRHWQERQPRGMDAPNAVTRRMRAVSACGLDG